MYSRKTDIRVHYLADFSEYHLAHDLGDFPEYQLAHNLEDFFEFNRLMNN